MANLTLGDAVHTGSIVVPEAWRRLVPSPLRGSSLVIGAVDVGKSTLVRWLYSQALAEGLQPGVLDLDLGQSTVGAPAMLHLALPDGADDTFPPRGPGLHYFVGAKSPPGHMLALLSGASRLQSAARDMGITDLIIDSDGLIEPVHGGHALKQWLAEMLQPQLILALQRHDELDSLLAPLCKDRRWRVVVLPVSSAAAPRSPEYRIARRARMFERYFQSSGLQTLDLSHLAVYGAEQLIPGRLVGLLDERGLAVGMGLAQDYRRAARELDVLTPLPTVKTVTAVRVGSLILHPDGREGA